MKADMETEARLFAAYLGAKHPTEELIDRYCKGVEMLAIRGSYKEMKVLNKLLTRSFLLPLMDAGFGLLKPQHVIRKRLLVMAALIETDKTYTHLFILEQDISMPIYRFIYRGSLAVAKACLGSILVIVCRWK
jgi:hypothetical protein